jgi:SAM-dependent methyltransferase
LEKIEGFVVEFKTKEWLSHHEEVSAGLLKRLFYGFYRPLASFKYSRYLSPETIQQYKPHLCLGLRGMPLESRRRWGSKYVRDIRDSLVLIQGTGTGWDVISWAQLRPQKIIATDIFPFEDSWGKIAQYCYDRFKVAVEFQVADIEAVSFLDSNSIDLIASDAVYEHCRDLSGVMRESLRILKPGGCIYASYGPLYYCAGGDHFSGRGGLETCFNHLILEPDAYQHYLEAHRGEVEDFQSGARYIELRLFSYLTTADYIRIFHSADLVVKSLILEISPQALQFKKLFPDRFNFIVAKYKDKCSRDDLLIKAHLIILQKPVK